MAVPDYQSLMLPILRTCAEGEIWTGDLIEKLAKNLKLTEEDRAALLPSGRKTTFADRITWALTYLNKAGLVERSRRAHYQITARGRDVLASQPQRIDNRFLGQFPEFLTFRGTGGQEAGKSLMIAPVIAPAEETAALTPDDVMRSAHRQLVDMLADDLLERIRVGTPGFFESLVVQLLVKMGYGSSETDVSAALIGGPGDGGIDGVIAQDKLGLDRVYVQAKRYKEGNVIGSGAIRDFGGGLNLKGASKGIFVTTSTFTKDAIQSAQMSDAVGKRIVLVDGPRLTDLMIQHEVGCRREEVLVIKKIDEGFFEE